MNFPRGTVGMLRMMGFVWCDRGRRKRVLDGERLIPVTQHRCRTILWENGPGRTASQIRPNRGGLSRGGT
jgi:hypothetical protein